MIVDFHSIPSDVRKVDTNQVLADNDLFARYLDAVGTGGHGAVRLQIPQPRRLSRSTSR